MINIFQANLISFSFCLFIYLFIYLLFFTLHHTFKNKLPEFHNIKEKL